MNMTLECENAKAPVCINSPEIKIHERKTTKRHGAGVVNVVEAPTKHSADAIVKEEDINKIVEYGLSKKAFSKVALFIFGINTGYRCGDSLSFRVKDFYKENGSFRDVIYISEDKTGKARPVYFNKAVKTAIKFVIEKKNLTADNYVFRTDGNKRTYLVEFKRDDAGDIVKVYTSPCPYNSDGSLREIAPFDISTIIDWLKKTTKELGIYGHYSSHAMRQTFSEHIARNFEDNKNVLAASVALAHSSVKTTIEHYMRVDPNRLREKWLSLNLGLAPLEDYIKKHL